MAASEEAVKIPPRDLVRIKVSESSSQCGVLQHGGPQVISMGEGGVGKSCIIKRYCEEQVSLHHSPPAAAHRSRPQFVTRYISTIGVDYGVKSVDVEG